MSDFERNLMSDLIAEYKANGKKKVFDLKKIRKKHADGGFGIMATEGKDLQKEIDDLVKKGLIEDLGGGKYQISDLGIELYS